MNTTLAHAAAIVADSSAATVVNTAPVALGENNYAGVTLNIQAIVDQSSGTPSLSIQGQGSNDGINWSNITDLAISGVQAVGSSNDEHTVAFAFLRFEVSLSVGGSGTDWGAMFYDIHANLVRQ